jgi:PAS domain S-box-containing protein
MKLSTSSKMISSWPFPDEQEKKFQDFLEDAPIGVKWLDKEGHILWANKAELNLLGYQKSEVVGKCFIDFHTDKAQMETFLACLTSGETLNNFECCIRCKDGSQRNVSISSNCLWENGKFVHARCFTRDLTDRKHIEGSLRQYNEEMEQFAHVTSHDLKEPLRIISLYLALLEKRVGPHLDKIAREHIQVTVNAAKRMRNLIDALLSYALAGRRTLKWKLIDTESCVKKIIENLDDCLEQKHGVIEMDKLPKIVADDVLISQVFQHLISNALKFSAQNPEIHIGAKAASSGDWIFFVKDNGIGLDMDFSEHIYNAFKRLHTSEEFPGIGIGLTLCKRIIERHHGRMWVNSKLGAGSTFYFSIPRI